MLILEITKKIEKEPIERKSISGHVLHLFMSPVYCENTGDYFKAILCAPHKIPFLISVWIKPFPTSDGILHLL
jgi:hypothetical protein